MKKIIISILIFIIIITNTYKNLYADDEDGESENYDISELVQVNANIEEVPKINSRHAIVYDRKSGEILYGKKENERCKMASTTKIMTSLVVLENVSNLNEKVKISAKSAGTGGSRLGLHTNDEITVNNLLYGLLLCSGNDTAVALAEYVSGSIEEFAKLMNQKAEELKLENTHFVTPHGLDEEEHYTTAYELAKITDYALQNEKFQKIVKTSNYTVKINGNAKSIQNTNELLGSLNGVYGVKTGFTNGANRCLVTAVKRDNMDIISVVLGADTKKDRTKDSIEIIEYAYAKYQMIDLEYMIHDELENISQSTKFNVIKGKNNEIKLGLEENEITLYPVKKEKIKDIKIEAKITDTLNAPVYTGQNVGKMSVYIGEKLIYEIDICTKNAIQEKDIWDYWKQILQQLFANLNFTSYNQTVN